MTDPAKELAFRLSLFSDPNSRDASITIENMLTQLAAATLRIEASDNHLRNLVSIIENDGLLTKLEGPMRQRLGGALLDASLHLRTGARSWLTQGKGEGA